MTGAFYAAAALLRHTIAQVRALPLTSSANACSTTTLLALLMQLGYVYSVGPAQQEQAEVAATEALENTKLLIRSYHVLMAVAYGTSNFAHGQALGETALQLAQGSELGRESAMCLSAAGLTATAHQDYATALPYLTQALAWAEAVQDSRKASLFRNQLGTLYREIGDFGQALRCFEQNLPATLKQDDAYNTQFAAISQAPETLSTLLLAEVGLATLHLAQGDRAAAHAAVEAPLARFDPTRFDTFFTAARFLLVAYQILVANDDLHAATILAQAWQIVTHFAEKISDPALRHAFLTNVPVHRQLGELIGG